MWPGFSRSAVRASYVLPAKRIRTPFLLTACHCKSRQKSSNRKYCVGKHFPSHSCRPSAGNVISKTASSFGRSAFTVPESVLTDCNRLTDPVSLPLHLAGLSVRSPLRTPPYLLHS